MKKTLAVAALTLAAPFASADTILGVYAGAGAWMTGTSGNIGSDIDLEDDLKLDDSTSIQFYVALEHPVPLIPNVRIKRTDLTIDGDGSITGSVGDISLTGDVKSTLDLSHTDFTLYYEILDNWISLDVGLTARLFDGSISFDGTGVAASSSSNEDLSFVVPMGYAMAQFELPLSGLYAGGDVNVISMGGNTLSDINVQVGYDFPLPVIDLGIAVGYRQFGLKLDDDLGDFETDVNVSGPYVNATFHF
jgi:outer membrane protein